MSTLQPLHISRQVLLPATLFLAVWATQLRYPPLSYPYIGQMLVIILAGFLVLLPIWSKKARPTSAISHPALLPGFLFVLWVLVRWALTGFTARGAEEVGTILWLSVYTLGAYWLGTMHRPDLSSRNSLINWFLMLLAMAGFLCGLHAIWQYHVSYQQTYQQLLQSIGAREPDPTELGLLYHLQLRRVASVFGDPNNLATFSALAMCASIELLTSSPRWPKIIGAIAIIPILAAVYYSGSRGGLLDVLGVLALYAILFFRRNVLAGTGKVGTAVIMMAALFAASGDQQISADQAANSAESESSWEWRSSTIQERIYYLQVGQKMIKLAPMMGLGPGSVDVYFGRLKAPEARETKYLHNWVIQIAAELGLIGVALSIWFLGALIYTAWRKRLPFQPIARTLCIMILMVMVDAMIQVTWNQRELISTFGIICGFTMAVSASPAAATRFSAAKTTAAAVVIGTFIVTETMTMANQAAKQTASDFGYAGDLRQADKYWRKAIRWLPNDSEPYAARASIALQEGRRMQAKNLIDKALQLSPESASLHVQAANIYQSLGKGTDSDKHLTRALDIYPTQPEYNYRMALSLADRGLTTQALTYAHRAQKYNYLPEKAPDYQKLITGLEAIDQ